MSLLSSWRTALRIARREAARSKGRSALVVAMIALPIVALALAASTYDMFTLTPAESATRTLGSADARITWPAHAAMHQEPSGNSYWQDDKSGAAANPDANKPGTADELMTLLPGGSSLIPVLRGTVVMKTPDGIAQPNGVSVDATSPLVTGYLSITAGRAPTAADEVALSAPAEQHLATSLGGTVTSGDGKRTFHVVGVVEFPSSLDEWVLFAPMPSTSPDAAAMSQPSWLVKTPSAVTWSQVKDLNTHGVVVVSREVLLNPPPASEVDSPVQNGPPVTTRQLALGVLVSGLALLEIVLMAGPAFAVSARRRQRQLALVAANGGTPAHVRRIVLADGVVLGVVGAATGIVVGIVAAFAIRPEIEVHVAHARAGGYRVFPIALIAIAALAVVTGVLAALVPAFITSRQNVITSLAGRRGVTRSRKRWLALGLAGVAIGTAIVLYGTKSVDTTVMLAGMIIGELGLVLCTPSLVGMVARIGRILPLAPRIALRDAARNRAAAAPAISAVMAAVAGSVAIGLYFAGSQARTLEFQPPRMPIGYVQVMVPADDSGVERPGAFEQISQALRATLPIADIQTVERVGCPTLPTGTGTGTSGTSGATGTDGTSGGVGTAGGVGGPTKPLNASGDNRYCDLPVVRPASQVCPFLSAEQSGGGFVTDQVQQEALRDPRCLGSNVLNPVLATMLVADGSALGTLTGADAADLAQASAALAAGGVVVGDPSVVHDGVVTIQTIAFNYSNSNEDPYTTSPRIDLPAYALHSGTLADAIMSPATLASLHYTERGTILVASTTRMPTVAEQERAVATLAKLGAYPEIQDPINSAVDPILWVLMVAAGLVTLAAAAIGTGLAAADGRADLSTLAAVGASPRMRRGLSVSQSGVIAGLGSLLGAAAGIGACAAIIAALNVRYLGIWPQGTPFPFRIPWLSLLVALVVVPGIAVLGAGLLTRSRLPIERRL